MKKNYSQPQIEEMNLLLQTGVMSGDPGEIPSNPTTPGSDSEMAPARSKLYI